VIFLGVQFSISIFVFGILFFSFSFSFFPKKHFREFWKKKKIAKFFELFLPYFWYHKIEGTKPWLSIARSGKEIVKNICQISFKILL
jgi:hypothetical protein